MARWRVRMLRVCQGCVCWVGVATGSNQSIRLDQSFHDPGPRLGSRSPSLAVPRPPSLSNALGFDHRLSRGADIRQPAPVPRILYSVFCIRPHHRAIVSWASGALDSRCNPIPCFPCRSSLTTSNPAIGELVFPQTLGCPRQSCLPAAAADTTRAPVPTRRPRRCPPPSPAGPPLGPR